MLEFYLMWAAMLLYCVVGLILAGGWSYLIAREYYNEQKRKSDNGQ